MTLSARPLLGDTALLHPLFRDRTVANPYAERPPDLTRHYEPSRAAQDGTEWRRHKYSVGRASPQASGRSSPESSSSCLCRHFQHRQAHRVTPRP